MPLSPDDLKAQAALKAALARRPPALVVHGQKYVDALNRGVLGEKTGGPKLLTFPGELPEPKLALPPADGLLKYNEHHKGPGPGGGQFASADGSGSGSHSMQEMLDRVLQPDGGFTYQPTTKDSPTEGFAVSIYPDRSFAKPAKDLKMEDLTAYVIKNQDVFSKADHYIGAWHDPNTGIAYLDVSVVKHSAAEARSLGSTHDQLAYFDLKEGKSVEISRDAKSGGALERGSDGKA